MFVGNNLLVEFFFVVSTNIFIQLCSIKVPIESQFRIIGLEYNHISSFSTSQSISMDSFYSIRFQLRFRIQIQRHDDNSQILTPTSIGYSLFSLEVGDAIVLWTESICRKSADVYGLATKTSAGCVVNYVMFAEEKFGGWIFSDTQNRLKSLDLLRGVNRLQPKSSPVLAEYHGRSATKWGFCDEHRAEWKSASQKFLFWMWHYRA